MATHSDQIPVPGLEQRTVAIVGPTASGKSDLAVALARAPGGQGARAGAGQPAGELVGELVGEIVNTDSMQLYRGMDIGTAKHPEAERRGVPHLLIDVLDIDQRASVAAFQRAARAAIAQVHARGRMPILVGGSALYTRAVLDRFDFPGTDPAVRRELELELDATGPEALHDRLRALDPEAAARILPTNGRRIVRALEVVELTGGAYRAALPARSYAFDGIVQLGLDIPRDVLDARIEQRVTRMWQAGFVDEVRRLERAGLRSAPTASRALGYRQVLGYLAGQCTQDEARLATVRATCRFARRQDAWFRKDDRIVWLPFDAPDLEHRAREAVTSALTSAAARSPGGSAPRN